MPTGDAKSALAEAPEAASRYTLHDRLASGGMASVHLGQLQGDGGFARIVAIKKMHPHLCEDPAFVAMFLDEARLASRIRHPNVVPTLDVVSVAGELWLVMEYVPGESLSRLLSKSATEEIRVPPRIAAAIVCDALEGLHAAHEAQDVRGEPLHLVHRDVSPQNILVGADGSARLLDFGVAMAVSRLAETREGEIKGKLAYMAPEQFHRDRITRAVDIYAAGVVLWEALAGRRLHDATTAAATIEQVLYGTVEPIRSLVPELPAAVDDVIARSLSRDPQARFATAGDMAEALRAALPVASAAEVRAWIEVLGADALSRKAALVAAIEVAVDTKPHVSIVSSSRGTAAADHVPITTVVELPSEVRRVPRRSAAGVAIGVTIAAGLVGVAWAAHRSPSDSPATARPEPAAPPASPPTAPVASASDTAVPVEPSTAKAPSASAAAPARRPPTSLPTTVKRPKRPTSTLPSDLPVERE